jgi:hypothetical protein
MNEPVYDEHLKRYRTDPSYKMGYDVARAHGLRWQLVGPRQIESAVGEHLFFKTLVTGQLLEYSTLPVIDFHAREALKDWFMKHGYSVDELKNRTVEVTYRVLSKGEWT